MILTRVIDQSQIDNTWRDRNPAVLEMSLAVMRRRGR